MQTSLQFTQIKNRLLSIKNEAPKKIKEAKNNETLKKIQIFYFGRKGELAKVTKELGKLPKAQRREIGEIVNEIKETIKKAIEKKSQRLSTTPPDSLRPPAKDWHCRAGDSKRAGDYLLPTTPLDITIPGKKPSIGYLHPITKAIFEIENIFSRLGFVRRRYPEVEEDYYAFEALNMPKDHPARDDFETFYISQANASEMVAASEAPSLPRGKAQRHITDKIILTPHTSSGQIREMKKGKFPIRMLNIAKCYRPQIDASHTPMFFQFEGLLLDKEVCIAELKGTLDFFAENYFGEGSKMRLRPYDFRFTEPSFEVDVTCTNCNGRGCKFCKEGWLELGGAGMVHPKVIKNGGLDPKKVNGFAFGWGVERVAAIKYKIPDIRMLYQNDLRFLEQF